MKKNIFYYGYLYGFLGGLFATIIFTVGHVIVNVIINGVSIYLQYWKYPIPIFVLGVLFSLVGAGPTGVVLLNLLRADMKRGILNYKLGVRRGIYLGLISILIIFGLVLLTPLASVFFRLGDLGLLFFLVVVMEVLIIGGVIGKVLTKLLLESHVS
jgi:hypothetical protein